MCGNYLILLYWLVRGSQFEHLPRGCKNKSRQSKLTACRRHIFETYFFVFMHMRSLHVACKMSSNEKH